MRGYADALLAACRLEEHVVHRRDLPAHPAEHAATAEPLSEGVSRALSRAGIQRLFSHQARAIDAARAGRSVLATTPTASGKSLIYNIPVLEACVAAPETRALYVFPYKALEQDQQAAFRRLAAAVAPEAPPGCEVYDGDTPTTARKKIRADPPSVLITNPDMLHLSILARHQDWASFLSRLRFVVFDELHVYRGVFGTHFHHIVQRLKRLCASYGSTPTFIAASATVGEPQRLAAALLGEEVTVIDRSGAPRAGRHIAFLNPGMAMSPYTAATRLMARAVQQERRTITFTKARRVTELIHSWLVGGNPEMRGRVASYRAGYLPEERRRIEKRLARGETLGVVTTSALELGVDIGGLDVCILVGYPGSITSAWQRIGRVGRADRESLVLLVGMPDALDQYFLTHPEEFFNRPFEPVVLDPAHPETAGAHLVCAAAEQPLTREDESRYGKRVFALVDGLTQDGRLLQDADEERWFSLRRSPQRDVSLRSISGTFEIRDGVSGRMMGTVDSVRARMECHTGAIYLHAGRSYRVLDLDFEKKKVTAEPAFDSPYFTQPLTEKETEILEHLDASDAGTYRLGLGRLKVTTFFKGYLKKRISDQQVISEHELDLPPAMFETVGTWVELPRGLGPEIGKREGHFMGAIHATEHATIGLFPLLAVCDRGDLGGISYPEHPQIGGPAFFIYDGHTGGVGLAAEGFRRMGELLQRTRDVIEACACDEGCPSCVQSPKCGNGNRPLDKQNAVYLLDVLTGRADVPPEPPGAAHAVGVATPISDAPGERAGHASGLPVSPAGHGLLGGTPHRPPGVVPVPEKAPPDLFFDLETMRSAEDVGGWDRIDRMGLALAVVYDRGRDRWRTYREGEAKDLIIDLLSAPRVVGFNVKRFDYAVLTAYAPADFHRVQTLDMLEEIKRTLGFRLSLAHLGEATLGAGKAADGLDSLAWVREGRWDLVEAYCRRDVELTMQLFDYGRLHGHLLFHDRDGARLRLPVDWR